MNRREHALLARRLIQACGGLEEAAKACRIGKSRLSDCENPFGEGFMPADVIHDLEAYCAKPIYSRALFEVRPEASSARDLRDEAAEAVESVVALSKEIRLATEDGELTPAERDRLGRSYAEAEDELRDVGQLIAREA